MPQSANDLQTLAQEQQALLMEARRRLGARTRIDGERRAVQREAQRERLETLTGYESGHKGEISMSAVNRPSIFATRLPRSGNAALGASAVIQAVLGIEFVLSSLNKLADAHYLSDFAAFVRSTPGAMSGVLSSLIQALVLPNIAIVARLVEISELLIGVVLLIGAVDVGRRRFAGRVGAQHGYERPLALGSALAGLAAAGLTLSIGILMGEGLPTIAVGRAFSSAIPIELFIVPLGVAIAWLELGRFLALRRALPPVAAVRARFAQPVRHSA